MIEKETLKEICNELEPYFIVTLKALTGFHGFILVLSFLLKYSFLIVDILLGMCFYMIYYGVKDLVTEEEKKKAEKIFSIYTILCSSSVLLNSILFLSSSFKPALVLLPIGCVLYVTICLLIRKDEEKHEVYMNIKTYNIWADQKLGIHPGDTLLGMDVATSKDVVLHLLDRFVHMLIIGPTGSGKTSQVILPMIYQDIKNPDVGVIALEPKGDLAEKVYALSELEGRHCIYFNPQLKDCPFFNPLMGDETDVIENMVTTFKTLARSTNEFFEGHNENLIRNSLRVLKQLYHDEATLIDLNTLINNINGEGMIMVAKFSKVATDPVNKKKNDDIAYWFTTDYFTGTTGSKNATKTYEHCSQTRNQVSKLNANYYLSRVLNPPKGALKSGAEFLDFDKILAEGGICAISSEQGKLRELSKFLGYFLILQLQSAVFRRPGTEWTRRPCMLYIDEFQTYANNGFSDMLTQGRSYRVASHLATQNRDLIGVNSGTQAKNFINLVSTNARNLILFPGANVEDAQYFSKQFGTIEEIKSKWLKKEELPGLFRSKGLRGETSEIIQSTSERSELFTPTDITYGQFGEIIYCLIQDKSPSRAGRCKVEFISKDISGQMDDFLNKYKEEQIKVQDDIADDEPTEDLFFSYDEPEIGLSDYEPEKDNSDLFDEEDDDVFDPFADI